MDRTILVIEDEQNINDILTFSLGKEGYKTLSQDQLVEFDLIETSKGFQAKNVTLKEKQHI